jgi:hypothetical protein
MTFQNFATVVPAARLQGQRDCRILRCTGFASGYRDQLHADGQVRIGRRVLQRMGHSRCGLPLQHPSAWVYTKLLQYVCSRVPTCRRPIVQSHLHTVSVVHDAGGRNFQPCGLRSRVPALGLLSGLPGIQSSAALRAGAGSDAAAHR